MAEPLVPTPRRGFASTPQARRWGQLLSAGRDTRPELAVRSACHRLGLRYLVNTRPLPQLRRTADLVFPRLRVAVLVDGCYWHGCPECTARHQPKTNADYWRVKLLRNVERDRDTDRRLKEAGWVVIRVWEHEDPIEAARRVQSTVQAVRDRFDSATDSRPVVM